MVKNIMFSCTGRKTVFKTKVMVILVFLELVKC